MIELKAIGFTRLQQLPLALEHVRDLEEYDGPLLSEFRSDKGETYLYKWCDSDEHSNRWIILRAPPAQLFPYLLRKATLRQLVLDCLDRAVYLVDLDNEANVSTVWFGGVDRLPPDYVPSPESHFSGELSSVAEGSFQDVFVGSSWNYEKSLAAYPRKYLQAYAFLTLFGKKAKPVASRALASTYDLTGGWVFHHIFEKMRSEMPFEKRGKLVAAAMASPGYLRFEVHPDVADDLRTAVRQFISNRAKVRSEYRQLVEWSNATGALKNRIPDNVAKGLVLSLCAELRVNGENVLRQSDNLRQSAKIVASYFRRIEFIAEQQTDGSASMLGFQSETER